MKQLYFLLSVLSLGLDQDAFSQVLSNTDNTITLNNTCLNGGIISGSTYTLELNYYDLDQNTNPDRTFSVVATLSNGVLTLTAPAGSFPTPATTIYQWSLSDAWPGSIKLTQGGFSNIMFYYSDPNSGNVGINCTPLPIYFSSFSGILSGSSVALNWVTQSELPGCVFEVYRSSTGSNYYKIGQVAQGTSSFPRSYSFTDNNPDATNFYYLKMVSAGLQSIQSTTSTVNCSTCHYTPPAPVFCNFTINGPDQMCSTGTYGRYSLSSSVPNFSTIAWSVDQPFAAVLRTYPDFDRSKACMFRKNSPAGVTLTATLSGCTNPITKFVTLGTPTPVVNAQIIRCPILDATMSNAPGATSYEWWLTDENTGNTTAFPGSGISKAFQMTSSDVYDVEGAYTNACGTSSQAFAFGFQCGASFSALSKATAMVSPNPSRGVVNIQLAPAVGGTAALPRIYQVRVVDLLGVVRKTMSYPGGEVVHSVDLGELNNGLYIIQVFDNKTWRSSKVILNK